MKQFFIGFVGGLFVMSGYWLLNRESQAVNPDSAVVNCTSPQPKVVEKVVFETAACPQASDATTTTGDDRNGQELSSNQPGLHPSRLGRRQLPKQPSDEFLQAFEAQPVDPDWAYEMEQNLRYQLSSLLAEHGGTIDTLSCRSSACFVTFNRKGELSKFVSMSLKVRKRLERSLGLGLDRAVLHHMSPDTKTFSYCIARTPRDCDFAIIGPEQSQDGE